MNMFFLKKSPFLVASCLSVASLITILLVTENPDLARLEQFSQFSLVRNLRTHLICLDERLYAFMG